MASTIKPVDAVRTAADLKPADLEGIEGRWLDVPRLQQRSGEVRSNFWCGRASAAMVYDYYCKAQKKDAEYVGHDELNIRFLGGSNKGKLAGVTETGEVHPQGLFDVVGWKTDSGELASSLQGIKADDAQEVEKRFARHIEQLKKNNPVVQFTQLADNRGHIVVIGGYKKDTLGALWLRIVDPCWPNDKLLGAGNFKMITRPETPDKEFSEYWLKASRLLAIYPGRTTRMFSHADAPLGYFFYVLPPEPVKDDSELIHKIGKGLGETAGAKPGDKKAGPQAPCPPATGVPRLPVMMNGSNMVTGEAITSLYHQTERGMGGFFPLGDNGLFHCGAHIVPPSGAAIGAMADGEVVAARIGMGPGEHPWGDTGFVILRHKLENDKNIYCLYMHLKKEPIHPDRTEAGWLKRLLIGAMQGKEARKPKWRVTEAQPTWKDEDKGRWSPVNVHPEDKLDSGVYEEDAEFVQDSKRYVKLEGKWVRAAGPDGEGGKVKELSPWSDFDIDEACKKSALVKDLRDGKTAVLDVDKNETKKHKWTVDAGETVGHSGWYLTGPTLHWSVFSKDAVFTGGSLPDKEFSADEQPKVADLDLSSKEAGTKDHAKALIEALDKDKKFLGKKQEETIIEPGELRHFYRTPTQCWRARYQAVKAVADFKLDLEKLVKQDRYKSHTDAEKGDFTKSGKTFLFWDELSKAEDFPTDGKAVFVHPVTALRMMSQVRVEQDHDDAPEKPGPNSEDRTHAGEDVVIVLRDAKGPLATVEVTVKADGAVVRQGKTDSQGELVVRKEDVIGKDIEVSVDAKVVGDKGQLIQVANETNAPASLLPGDAPGNQTFNGEEVVPNPRLALPMKVKKGARVKMFGKWNAGKFEPENPGKFLDPEACITAERIVFRKDDGKLELIEAIVDRQDVFCWSIENGEEKIGIDLDKAGENKEPTLRASWSARIAHLIDHPVLAGRVRNIDDGTELEITFLAMMAVGAPEHDHQLGTVKVKVAGGGFAAGFDPHQLTSDNNLLNAPRPVTAKVKVKGNDISLRDQAITIYGDAKFPDPKPKPSQEQGGKPGGKELVAYYEIDRAGEIDHMNTFGGDPAPERSLSQLSGAVAERIKGDGWDKIYVGAAAAEQHLALSGEENMTPAQALEHHTRLLKASFPDAPDWIIATDPETAWKADNGLQAGICAIHCKTQVCGAGAKTGCTEKVRVSNLSSCHTAAYAPCQTAIQLGHPPVVKSCGNLIGACGSAGHDKSHCFLEGPVLGDNAEDRERWHVRLPLKIKGAGYPYSKSKDRPLNLKVVLVNPKSGAAVVCSQEDRGPDSASSGNEEVPEAAVKANEFLAKDRLLGLSYEAVWKLGLNRKLDPVVLMAFVDAATPLGPVAAEVVIKLKKTTSFEKAGYQLS